jgi:hypothetical protein
MNNFPISNKHKSFSIKNRWKLGAFYISSLRKSSLESFHSWESSIVLKKQPKTARAHKNSLVIFHCGIVLMNIKKTVRTPN